MNKIVHGMDIYDILDELSLPKEDYSAMIQIKDIGLNFGARCLAEDVAEHLLSVPLEKRERALAGVLLIYKHLNTAKNRGAANCRFDTFYGRFFTELFPLATKIGWNYLEELVTKIVPLKRPEEGYPMSISLYEMTKVANKLVDFICKRNHGVFHGFSEEEVSILVSAMESPSYVAEKLLTYMATRKSKNQCFWVEMDGILMVQNRRLNHTVIPFFDKLAKDEGIGIRKYADDIEWLHVGEGAGNIGTDMKILSRLGTSDFHRYRSICDSELSRAYHGPQALFKARIKSFIAAALGEVPNEMQRAYVFRFLDLVPSMMKDINYAKLKYFDLLVKNMRGASLAPHLPDLEDLQALFAANAKDGFYTRVAMDYPLRTKELREIDRYNITIDDAYVILRESAGDPIDLSWIETHKVKRKDVLNLYKLKKSGVPDHLLFAS